MPWKNATIVGLVLESSPLSGAGLKLRDGMNHVNGSSEASLVL